MVTMVTLHLVTFSQGVSNTRHQFLFLSVYDTLRNSSFLLSCPENKVCQYFPVMTHAPLNNTLLLLDKSTDTCFLPQ